MRKPGITLFVYLIISSPGDQLQVSYELIAFGIYHHSPFHEEPIGIGHSVYLAGIMGGHHLKSLIFEDPDI